MHISVSFNTFTLSCNQHLYFVPKHFHHPVTMKQSLPIHYHFQPLANINLVLVSTDLLILDISYKWNHIICDLLCLA